MADWRNPTVAQQLLFSTVRLVTVSRNGESIFGTSFVLLHTFPKGRQELFLVTNKHVVADAQTGTVFFTRPKPDGGPDIGNPFHLEIDAFEAQWHGHPDPDVDVAVLPISWQLEALERAGDKVYLMRTSTSVIASRELLAASDVFQPVVFVGYPQGLFDEANHTPIVRQGTTATHPELDFSGRPVFLIDASVFPGSSGSPVFGFGRTWEGWIGAISLLGIIAEAFEETELGTFELVPAPTKVVPRVTFNQVLNLGVVFKSYLIQEVIDDFGQHHGL